MVNDWKNRLNDYTNMVDAYLLEQVSDASSLQKSVIEAMKYSLTAGGKRIRPVLALEFARALGAQPKRVLPFASAIEMVHCYSLIHDDLPCMDDDDMRRGQPSCHIQFSESTALLAGDALLTLAFESMSRHCDFFAPEQVLEAIHELSASAGVYGMIGGQVIDLESEGKRLDVEHLTQMHLLKTGALIKASVRIGCILGGADDDYLKHASLYAQKLGLAFQVVDDILDVTGDAEKLGKPIGSDKGNEKNTYTSLYGLEQSKKIAEQLTEEALQELSQLRIRDGFLRELTGLLLNREH
nr:farnesyl diphosphate synthase [Candidatus Soleaferrea massiliensis]